MTTRFPRYVVLAVCLSILSSARVTRATGADEQLSQQLQSRLDSLRAAGSIPGVTAAVAFPDGRMISLMSGFADTTSHLPMTSHTLLMQGSIGKTYVSAVALQLVHEGKLDLDAKVGRYLGSYDWYARIPNASDITVRMLMNHTSGVMRYEFKDAFTKDLTAHPEKTWKPEELVAYVLGDTASFPAGTGWEYSDTNYILLGMILEKITGVKYYDLVRTRILDKFGLKNTVPVEGPEIAGLAQGYAGENNPFGGTSEMLRNGRFVINPQFEWTGGGVASTSADLARWATIVYTGKAFDPSLMDQFLNGVPARLGPNARYGLGVILRNTRWGPSYGHSGFFPGYLAEMMYFPDKGFSVVVQINSSDFRNLKVRPGRILYELAQLVAERAG